MNLLFLVFGSCLASFINTMVWRYGLSNKHASGRFSHCDSCQHRLRSWQLIPIIGYLLQRGYCHDCHAKLDPWLPCCEAIFAVFTSTFLRQATWKSIPSLIAISCLLVIASQDHYDHAFSWPWLSGILGLIVFRVNWDSWPYDLLLISLFLPFYLSPKIGHGDCDLLILMTIILGMPTVCYAIMAACLLACCHPALYRHQAIAFAPCLGLALAGSAVLPLLRT